MVIDMDDLTKESKDFDKIYTDRFANMKSIMLDDERVEDYYYKNPWRYGFSRHYAFQQIIDSFKKVVANRPGNSLKILEIGCGNGWFSINININNEFRFTSIDVSQEAINNATIYAKQNNITQNEYICTALETFDGGGGMISLYA